MIHILLFGSKRLLETTILLDQLPAYSHPSLNNPSITVSLRCGSLSSSSSQPVDYGLGLKSDEFQSPQLPENLSVMMYLFKPQPVTFAHHAISSA